MFFCHVMSRYEGKTKIIITPKDRITKIILFSIKHNMGYGESGKLNRWPWCETSLTCPLSVTGRTSFALKYIDIHSWKNDNSHVCHLVGVEDDGLLRVVLLHHLDGDPGDGGLEVGLLSVHHAPHVQLPGSLDTDTWHSYTHDTLAAPAAECWGGRCSFRTAPPTPPSARSLEAPCGPSSASFKAVADFNGSSFWSWSCRLSRLFLSCCYYWTKVSNWWCTHKRKAHWERSIVGWRCSDVEVKSLYTA